MKTSLLEAVEIHNNNKHTTTLFKPIDLINNTDEEKKQILLQGIRGDVWRFVEICGDVWKYVEMCRDI